jgi:hypothetical protein
MPLFTERDLQPYRNKNNGDDVNRGKQRVYDGDSPFDEITDQDRIDLRLDDDPTDWQSLIEKGCLDGRIPATAQKAMRKTEKDPEDYDGNPQGKVNLPRLNKY